jgi:Cu(I)/Ag(I) efflux system membrane protein CusA/SilA
MVIYLEEAVERKRQEVGVLTHKTLMDAVIEGALLRLRPKVMTVSTVVAGLLPIMWSTSAGSEVMKPLATPVLGGMVSSLLHVLIVTPVIFFSLRSRQLEKQGTTSVGAETSKEFRNETREKTSDGDYSLTDTEKEGSHE